MRVYLPETVYEAALNRIRFLFREFDDVFVDISGGKDSTVLYHLALQVARETNRLPLKVCFLDQEAEWESTITYMRTLMSHQDVDPYWYQFQFKIENASSVFDRYLLCWDESLSPDDWMRHKEPFAKTQNIYDNDRWPHMFEDILRVESPGKKACRLCGVRTEESPGRLLGLTSYPTYKGRTWGRKHPVKNHFTFYPIYDWSLSDVWRAIHTNQWAYSSYYDEQYMRGATVNQMRVSNLHHEQAVQTLFALQEMEPRTYEKLCRRLKGVDMAGKFGEDNYFVRELPFMFGSWIEYRDFLVERLIVDSKHQGLFRARFVEAAGLYGAADESLTRMEVQSILSNDVEGLKYLGWRNHPKRMSQRVENTVHRRAALGGLTVLTTKVGPRTTENREQGGRNSIYAFRCKNGHEFEARYLDIPKVRRSYICPQCPKVTP